MRRLQVRVLPGVLHKNSSQFSYDERYCEWFIHRPQSDIRLDAACSSPGSDP